MLNRSDRNCLLGHGKHFVGKIDGTAAKLKIMLFAPRVLIDVCLFYTTSLQASYTVYCTLCDM
jgi:hypothetical protein